jgi:hypothetical protein
MKIENHPSILDAKPIIMQSGCVPHRIVLRWETESYHPYVTHMENLKLEGDTLVHEDFYCGHYFSTLEDAQRDFASR